VIDDLHPVPLPSDMPAGEYRVIVGMYDLETGQRLPVYDSNEQNVPNAAFVLDRPLDIR